MFSGTTIPSQIVPLPRQVIRLRGRPSVATRELVFQTGDIPGFGFLSFYISVVSSAVSFPNPNIGSKKVSCPGFL